MVLNLTIIQLQPYALNHITSALDNHLHMLGVFLDISKAFDSVDYSILTCKLSHYGICGDALD